MRKKKLEKIHFFQAFFSKNIKNGYGQNTTTYISTENLASDISVETKKYSRRIACH